MRTTSRRCGWIALAWALLLAPALAQQSALPAKQLAPAQLLAMLQAGGQVIYFRHASTDFGQNDNNMKSFDDCASQRNLVDKGRAEAKRIGAAIKQLGIPIGEVMASPYCRTVETAMLAFGKATRMQEARGGPAQPETADRYLPLKRLLGTPPARGTNAVVVSHGNPFHAIAGSPYLAEGEGAVLKPLGEARFEVIARIKVEDWDALKDNR